MQWNVPAAQASSFDFATPGGKTASPPGGIHAPLRASRGPLMDMYKKGIDDRRFLAAFMITFWKPSLWHVPGCFSTSVLERYRTKHSFATAGCSIRRWYRAFRKNPTSGSLQTFFLSSEYAATHRKRRRICSVTAGTAHLVRRHHCKERQRNTKNFLAMAAE